MTEHELQQKQRQADDSAEPGDEQVCLPNARTAAEREHGEHEERDDPDGGERHPEWPREGRLAKGVTPAAVCAEDRSYPDVVDEQGAARRDGDRDQDEGVDRSGER